MCLWDKVESNDVAPSGDQSCSFLRCSSPDIVEIVGRSNPDKRYMLRILDEVIGVARTKSLGQRREV